MKPSGRHQLKARWVEGYGIRLSDARGKDLGEREVCFAVSKDLRTASVYINGVGLIGGWNGLDKPRPFACLIESINEGYKYRSIADLPDGSVRNKRTKPTHQMEAQDE